MGTITKAVKRLTALLLILVIMIIGLLAIQPKTAAAAKTANTSLRAKKAASGKDKKKTALQQADQVAPIQPKQAAKSQTAADSSNDYLTRTVEQEGAQPEESKAADNQVISPKANASSYTWNGLQVQFDSDSGLLTIPGGTMDNSKTAPKGLGEITGINPLSIKTVEITGPLKIIGSADFLFSNAKDPWGTNGNLKELTSISGMEKIDTSEATSMRYMFLYCSSLKSLDVSSFNTSQVQKMSGMFEDCSSLTSLDVSSFNTSQVQDMSYMFFYCGSLTSLNLGSKFDTSQVQDMSDMFCYCNSLTSLDVSSFNTSRVQSMSDMFFYCSSLTSLNLGNKFDTSQVRKLSSMFGGCSSLTSLNLGSKFDTSQVQDMSYMFYSCQKLTSLDISDFDTSQVQDMSLMFYSCQKLTSLDISDFDTSQVQDMTSMFYSCQKLTSLDISDFDMNQVVSKAGMLIGLNNLGSLKLGDKNQLKDTGFDAPGTWQNVGQGTPDNPQGKNKWTAQQLVSNYDNTKDADTYVRWAYPVTIHYLDEKGNKLLDDGQVPGGIVNQTFIIKAPEIKNYTLKTPLEDLTVTFLPTSQEKTLVYSPNDAAPVVVHYRDEQGNSIASDVIITGKYNDPYSSVALPIYGYHVISIPSNKTGKMTDQRQEVFYTYAQDPVKVNNVTVKYQDEAGNSLSSDVILSGYVGDPYQTTAQVINNYTLKTKPENASGIFTTEDQVVTYIYSKNPVTGGDVRVHYQDEDKKAISSDIVLSGNVDETYQTVAQEIKGYTLKQSPENASGKFMTTTQDVIYIYSKKPAEVNNVTVHYQDEQGKPLANDLKLSGQLGTPYETQALVISGYTLKTTPANAQGIFTTEAQEVVYVYTRDNAINAISNGGSTTIITVPANPEKPTDSSTTGQAPDNSTTEESTQAISKPIMHTIMHNSYVYDEQGGRKPGWFGKGQVINTYGIKTIKAKDYYVTDKNCYVKANNIDGKLRKLKHRALVYNLKGKKRPNKPLKAGQTVRTYGGAIRLKKQWYYIIGNHELVKQANF